MDGFAYLPGEEPSHPGPLARFLPQSLAGIPSAFLRRTSRPAGWVLDPFGVAPRMDLEMARSGFRVLVAVNNPVTRFLLEAGANPPAQADLRAGMSELASARKGEDRIETHLQSLYLTECTKCHRQVPAEAFVWRRESLVLEGRILRCPCGDNGEYPATEADIALAANLAATDSLHRSRALERVAAPDDPDRLNVDEALECYLPRAVYALMVIVNKLDGFSLPPERLRALQAVILTAFDEANSLWDHPAERLRPKQLSLPTHFLEKNIWLALERSFDLWADGEPQVEAVNWPSLPGEAGGLCLFNGPMRDLALQLKDLPIGAVVTVLPRPNQAFWTLSALWAGWLWGREAAAPFKVVLHRRRYEWNWHANALHATMRHLPEHMPLNAPFFALLPEAEPSFLSAAMLSGSWSGFESGGMALRTRHDPVEILWQRRAFSHAEKETAEIDVQNIGQVLASSLQERGEPAFYLHLHAAGLAALAQNHQLREQGEALAHIGTSIQAALAGPEFVHYSESRNPETGLWGLKEWQAAGESLPDRVEMAVVRIIQKFPGVTLPELVSALNAELPGLQTPSLGLLRAVLASYAVETGGQLNLRSQDFPSARRTDLESAASALSLLASRLGFSLQRLESPHRLILWQESGETTLAFYLLVSAVAGSILRQSPYPAERSLLVLPGGRAGLLAYKLDRDPALRNSAEGWRIVKFRTLRRLAEMTRLTREKFESELSGDPIEPPEQMKLF